MNKVIHRNTAHPAKGFQIKHLAPVSKNYINKPVQTSFCNMQYWAGARQGR